MEENFLAVSLARKKIRAKKIRLRWAPQGHMSTAYGELIVSVFLK
jgi:hypothetical protein